MAFCPLVYVHRGWPDHEGDEGGQGQAKMPTRKQNLTKAYDYSLTHSKRQKNQRKNRNPMFSKRKKVKVDRN